MYYWGGWVLITSRGYIYIYIGKSLHIGKSLFIDRFYISVGPGIWGSPYIFGSLYIRGSLNIYIYIYMYVSFGKSLYVEKSLYIGKSLHHGKSHSSLNNAVNRTAMLTCTTIQRCGTSRATRLPDLSYLLGGACRTLLAGGRALGFSASQLE